MAEQTQVPTFVGGLMRGFQFGENIKDQRAQRKRAQQQFESQQQLTELKTQATKMELEGAKEKRRRDTALRSLTTAEQAYEAGNHELAVQEFQDGINALDMSLEDFSPEFAQAAETLERSMKGAEVSDEEQIKAANRVFRNKVRRNINEKTKRDGKEVTIKDKEIVEVAPAPSTDGKGNKVEPGIMARMKVTGETEDGETITWRAPLTERRSANKDDPATSIPVDDIARQVAGRKKIMAGFSQSPQFRDILSMAKTRAGAESQERLRTIDGEDLGLEGGLFQVNDSTGKITKVVDPPDVGEGFSVVRGEDLPNSNVSGGLYKVNDKTGEPTELVAPDEKPGGGQDLKASDENAIYRQATGLYGGTFDPQTGRISGLNEGAARNAQAIASRASQLFKSGEAPTRSEAVRLAAARMDPPIDIDSLPGEIDRSQNRGAAQGGNQQASNESGGARSGEQGASSQREEVAQRVDQQIQAIKQDAVQNGAREDQLEQLRQMANRAINEEGRDPARVLRRYQQMAQQLARNPDKGVTEMQITPGRGIVDPNASR